MKLNDALVGVLLLALSVAILLTVRTFPMIPGQNVGPGAFPGLLASLLAVCSVLLIIRGLRERGTEGWITPGIWLRRWPQTRSFLVTIGCLLFYIFVSDALGFIPTGIIVLCLMMWTLGVAHRLILPIAVVLTLVVHTIFYKGLRVPLPWGVLQPWLW